MNLIKSVNTLSTSSAYWLLNIIGGIGLLSVALFYQYILEELPCVVCIQIRLWIALLVLLSIVGYALRKQAYIDILMKGGVVLAASGFLERSYLLLGTERGFIFGDCGFDAGLPDWFPIEQWLPWLFQVETSCGYTPEIIFGITMAEVLIVLSAGFALLSVWVTLFSVRQLLRAN